MALMGFREYSRHRGVALRAVQKAIAAGRIKTVDVGGKVKIDSDQADRDWTNNTDPAKQSLLYSAGPESPAQDAPRAAVGGVASAAGAGAAAKVAPASTEPEDVDEPTSEDTSAYRRDRAERESIRKQKEQIELDQLRGRLVDKAEVGRLRFTEFRALRDALGNLGARIKDALAAEADPLRCEQIVEGEKDAILQDFADKVLTRGVMADGDDDEGD